MSEHPDDARTAKHAAVTAALRSDRMIAVLAFTATTHPHCRCRLRHGMSARELIALGSGCAERFVCPRLDRIRRAAGL